MKISSESPLIFMHIPKCGGMSLFSSLTETFGTNIVDLYDESPRSIGRFRLQMQDQSKMVYCGHFSYGLHEWISRDASYVSFVREPISRLISLYYYCQPTFKGKFNPKSGVSIDKMKTNLNYPDFFLDFEACIAGDYSPEAFFSAKSAELDNGMVRRFSGKGLSPEICTEQDLERAKLVIESSFSFVGLTERFPESVARLSELFGLPQLREKKVNLGEKARKSTGEVKFSDELVNKIKDMNRFDILLYDWIGAKFDSKGSFLNVKRVKKNPKKTVATAPLWKSVGNAAVRQIDLLTFGQRNLTKANLAAVKLISARVTNEKNVTLTTLYKPVGSKKADEFTIVEGHYSQSEAVVLLNSLTKALQAILKK